MEIWKDISGYEGLYMVSDIGRVKSLSRNIWNGKVFYKSKEKIIKGRPLNTRDGYVRVCLYKNKICKDTLVHRLVAEVFINKIKDKNIINHKDGNKQNNYIDNLEWCNYSENHKHSFSELGRDTSHCYNNLKNYKSSIQEDKGKFILDNIKLDD